MLSPFKEKSPLSVPNCKILTPFSTFEVLDEESIIPSCPIKVIISKDPAWIVYDFSGPTPWEDSDIPILCFPITLQAFIDRIRVVSSFILIW